MIINFFNWFNNLPISVANVVSKSGRVGYSQFKFDAILYNNWNDNHNGIHYKSID